MAKVQNSKNIAECFTPLSTVHERYRRQTELRQQRLVIAILRKNWDNQLRIIGPATYTGVVFLSFKSAREVSIAMAYRRLPFHFQSWLVTRSISHTCTHKHSDIRTSRFSREYDTRLWACFTSNVTAVTDVRSASFALVTERRHYNARHMLRFIFIFIVECGIARFLCTMRVFEIRTSSSSPWLPLCQTSFLSRPPLLS